MELAKFQALLERPNYGEAQLRAMLENALERGRLAHVHAAEAALDRRFPGWRKPASRKGGAQPTRVEFRGQVREVDSQKDAYIWLVERFIAAYPTPFTELNWETAFIAAGPRSLYFARSKERLFGNKGAEMAADPTKWHRLTNGWYAKLVLSERQKLHILRKLASLAKLEEGADWRWSAEGRAAPSEPGDELLRELGSSSPDAQSV